MKPARKNRLIALTGIFLLAAIAVSLILFAMGENLNHYYSLEQISRQEAPVNQRGIRVGGMVENGSIEREGDTLSIRFKITDFKHPPLEVHYTGILPDLFREGQGVIARGTLTQNNRFEAEEIVAKHDENYIPPEVKEDLEKSGYQHNAQTGNLN